MGDNMEVQPTTTAAISKDHDEVEIAIASQPGTNDCSSIEEVYRFRPRQVEPAGNQYFLKGMYPY